MTAPTKTKRRRAQRGVPDVLGHVRELLRWRERVPICEWAESNIRLSDEVTALPGPLGLDFSPYMRGILEAFEAKSVRSLTMVWATQTGKTTCQQVMLGYAVDQAPGPALWVLPTEALARRFSQTRLLPIMRTSPGFKRHFRDESYSNKTLEYHLDTMNVMFGWANSPAMLSSQPVCDLFLDEVDKFPPASKREAEPLKLAEERTKTYRWARKSKVVVASTPTVPEGPIWRMWLESDQQRYRVPCPHCGEKQALEFAHVKWPAEERDWRRIERENLAWMECEHCGGRIEDADKPAMLEGGQWIANTAEEREREASVGEGERAPAEGREDGEDRSELGIGEGNHPGFHLNVLYSPWVSFSEVAAEFLRVKSRPDLLQNFNNSWLALPWEERVAAVSGKATDALLGAAQVERGTLPPWTQLVTFAVDWHGPALGFYWMALALGGARRVHVVEYGREFALADVERRTIEREWRTEDGIVMQAFGGVDSNYETMQVYDWSWKWWPQMRPIRGMQTISGKMSRQVAIGSRPGWGRSYPGMALLEINTTHYKDMLAAMLEPVEGQARQFTVCAGAGDDLLRALRSEHKVRRGGKSIWRKRYSGINNHWWDNLVVACAIADVYGWMQLAPLDAEAPGVGASEAEAETAARQAESVARFYAQQRRR